MRHLRVEDATARGDEPGDPSREFATIAHWFVIFR
jgi:hypothetical protein